MEQWSRTIIKLLSKWFGTRNNQCTIIWNDKTCCQTL